MKNSQSLLSSILYSTAVLLLLLGLGSASRLLAFQAVPTTNVSSNGSMAGTTLQRNRVSDSAPILSPKKMIWSSPRFFVLRKSELWSLRTNIISFYAEIPSGDHVNDPIFANGQMFFTMSTADACLFAVDANTGKDTWRFRIKNSTLSAVAAAGDMVYTSDSRGNVYGIDQKTGEQKWQFSEKSRMFHLNSPVVFDGTVYVASSAMFAPVSGQSISNSDENLYALDARTGKLKWTFKGKGILTSPSINNGVIYFATRSSLLYAVDASSGAEKWRVETGKPVGSPAILDGQIFVADENGNLMTFSTTDGAACWKSSKGIKTGTSLALSNGTVFLGGREQNIFALDAKTGTEKWRVETNFPCSSPVVAGNIVHFPCQNEFLLALDAATGKELWKYKNQDSTITAPVLSAGRMYFVDRNGYAYAME